MLLKHEICAEPLCESLPNCGGGTILSRGVLPPGRVSNGKLVLGAGPDKERFRRAL